MGDFERPCFVDVDTQVDFVQPSGALPVAGAEQLIPIWKELTEFGETNKLPMIASVDCHLKDDPEFAHLAPHCISGSPGQVKIPETLAINHQYIANDKRDATVDFEIQIILEKQCLDIFSNVMAEDVISTVSCTTFAVYGVPTEHSVKSVVAGLLARGHRVHVVSDAICGLNPAEGEKALAEMANAGAAFIPSATLIDKVRQHLANRAL